MARLLTQEDFEWAAKEIGCEIAAIKAVDEVESYGEGFNKDGSPVILFEGHKFHKYTNGKYSDNPEYKDISYPSWTRKWYTSGKTKEIRQAGEYDRLKRAQELDKEAAIKSTSWGRYQIMGFNYELVGYNDIYTFFYSMGTSERKHLEAFVQYCKNRYYKGKTSAYWISQNDFYNFSGSYNGDGQKAEYSKRIRIAYNKHENG